MISNFNKIKVLSIHGYFLLPKNFKGSYEDALEEYLKYRRKKKLLKTPFTFNVEKAKYKNVSTTILWNRFLNGISTTNKRFVGQGQLAQLVNGKWIKINS